MWEKLKALFKSKGIEIPADKETEFKSEFEKMLEGLNNSNPDIAKLFESLKGKTDDTTSAALEALIKQVSILTEQNKNLSTLFANEKEAREKAIQAQKDADALAARKKVEDKIADALKNKKITEADKDLWKGRLEKDFDEWSKELDAKQVPKEFQSKPSPDKKDSPVLTGNKILDAVNQHSQAAAIENPFVYQPSKE
jgi:HD superfamily phosphohydrolase